MKKIALNTNMILIMMLLAVTACSSEGNDPIIDDPDPDPDPVVDKIPQSVITFNNPGQLIDVFFYDVKQANRNLNSLNQAIEIFSIDDANGLRIPIFGNAQSPAHPSQGVVIESVYNDVLNSIALAKQARGGKGLKIFASKKLENLTSFPNWVKDGNGVIPEKYAILIADFIEFMNSKGIQIDYLGIDNEYIFNEGKISPQKYTQTISSLRALATTRGFTVPILVGYEDYGPNKREWVKTLMDNNWGADMDIYGTHYYPQFRPLDLLKADLALIGNRPFWSTEPHWDGKADVNDFDEAEAGMVAFWDQIDVGMSGFMWWDYNIDTNSGVRSKLIRAASAPLLGSKPISITDIDGESITSLGKLQTRAFIKGKIITVYAVNMNSTIRNNYVFKLDGTSIESKINGLQWTETSPIDGNVKLLDVEGVNNNIFFLTLPARSITRFIFTIK